MNHEDLKLLKRCAKALKPLAALAQVLPKDGETKLVYRGVYIGRMEAEAAERMVRIIQDRLDEAAEIYRDSALGDI